jgi:hypothetical protein
LIRRRTSVAFHLLNQAFVDMRGPDFLRKDAETPLCEHYMAAGAVCSFSTNYEQLLEAARRTFPPAESRPGSADFSVRFWVDSTDTAQPPWPKPYVRGLDHLVFVGLDARSSMLANLRTRRVIGRFSDAMASETTYWRMVIFPMMLSILSGSVGLVELHASGVVRDQRGLILVGPSRSGKSTLAMALTRAGFSLLSDDRIFCSLTRGNLQAWGLPRPLKLRPEAASWFEDLRHREPTDVQNGERVFHLEPDQQRAAKCEPKLLVFLDRQQSEGFHMTPIKPSEARFRIEKDLLAETPEVAREQAKILDQLLSLRCCMLRYGGRPQMIVEILARAFLNGFECRLSEGTK